MLSQAAAICRPLGQRPLVVTGSTLSRSQGLVAALTGAGLVTTTFAIRTEPTLDVITDGVAAARQAGCDCVIGFGGGSVLDSAKAIAALLTNNGDLLDYLEVIGRAQPLAHPAAPCILIPTTAGTGAEVTRNAVLASPAHRVKVSLRGPQLLPRVALIDPELTYDLPRELTATTGLDALTQLIEPYVSSRANPLTDAICIAGLRRAARSLRIACDDGRNVAAREDMSLASLMGGLALANAGLGAVHGFAGPIGGTFPAPHGAICAALLPHVMEANIAALRDQSATHPVLARFDEIARIVTERPHAVANDAVTWVRELVQALAIPSLSSYGIRAADFPSIVTAAKNASSMKANPLPLSETQLTEILAAAV